MHTPTWGAAAFCTDMMIGVIMAMFHYPKNFLENGTGVRWAWLEIGADFVQPALLTIGMCYLPWNMSWWGQTALGTYVFHYYFSDLIGLWTWHVGSALAWGAIIMGAKVYLTLKDCIKKKYGRMFLNVRSGKICEF